MRGPYPENGGACDGPEGRPPDPPLPGDALRQCAVDLRRHPLAFVARKHGVDPVHLAAQLRQAGLQPVITPVELQYILQALRSTPPDEIERSLHLTSSQFEQICRRTLGVARTKSLDEVTEDEVIDKTRSLVDRLVAGGVLFDGLPRVVTSSLFVRNGRSQCITYAERHKQDDPELKHWPAVAYLLCKAYPGRFQPFQFRHSKTNGHFCGPQGRSNLLRAVRWVLTEKLGYTPDRLPKLVHRRGFARTVDLQFFGITYHVYRWFFRSVDELVAEAVKGFPATEEESARLNTNGLRQALIESGVDPACCAVPACSLTPVEIHHILRGRHRSDELVNLVPLCLSHHDRADRINQRLLRAQPADQRKDWLIDRLGGEGDGVPA
ncbi:MAG: HNH endonuclease [Phycisphaerae bacterium]|nr:HNH endonuclease [Phycisphaerae bacterium]